MEELGDHWGPAKLASGMGGANEAVIFMARQLKQRGYSVHVYANPGPQVCATIMLVTGSLDGRCFSLTFEGQDSGKEDDHGIWWHPFWAYNEGEHINNYSIVIFAKRYFRQH